MFGASWLLLTASILLNQPIDYVQQSNSSLVAEQRAETIEVLKEPIKLCSHDTKNGHKDCIPLEIINSNAQSQRLDNNQGSQSSDSERSSSTVKRTLVGVTWEGTTEAITVNDAENSEVSAINNPSLEETEESVAIERQNDESSTVLNISDRPIPEEYNKQIQNSESLLTTYLEKDDIWEQNNSLTELNPTPTVVSTLITTTEQLTEEEVFDESEQVDLEATTLEVNAQRDNSEDYFTENSYFYWFFSEETQE